MTFTIRCIERHYPKKEVEEEGDAMRSFISNNLASEHLKAYPNEAIQQAMNNTLNTLLRKGEEQPDELTCSMTFIAMKTTALPYPRIFSRVRGWQLCPRSSKGGLPP